VLKKDVLENCGSFLGLKNCFTNIYFIAHRVREVNNYFRCAGGFFMKVIKFEKPELKQEEFQPYFEVLLYRNAYLNQRYAYGLPKDAEPITFEEFSELLMGHGDLVPYKDSKKFIEYITKGIDASFTLAFIENKVTEGDKKYAAAKARQIRQREGEAFDNLVYNYLGEWSAAIEKVDSEAMKANFLELVRTEPETLDTMSELLDVICIREWRKCTESEYEDEIGKVFYTDSFLREFLDFKGN